LRCFCDGKNNGHHPFTKQLANHLENVMSADALDYASKQTIGPSVDMSGSDSKHKWDNKVGHPQYNQDALKMGDDYVKEKGISEKNKMTRQQAAELNSRLMKHEYNKSVEQYADEQRSAGKFRNNIFRGRGGSGQGQD
jgi:hypothetical protein